MALEFEYFDFIPRREFKEAANKLLNEICKEIPFSYTCEARCTYFANKFFFQIVFRNEDDITVGSQTILDPKTDNTRSRDWQVRAIEFMSSHLKKQIENLKNSKQNSVIAMSS